MSLLIGDIEHLQFNIVFLIILLIWTIITTSNVDLDMRYYDSLITPLEYVDGLSFVVAKRKK